MAYYLIILHRLKIQVVWLEYQRSI